MYAELAIAGVLVLLVVGLVFAAYRWGVRSQVARDAGAALKTSEKIQDAESRVHVPDVTDEWLSDGGAPTSRVGRTTPPSAH